MSSAPVPSHFSDSSEGAEEENAHLNSGCRHRIVVGPTLIQTLGKDMLWALLQRGRG